MKKLPFYLLICVLNFACNFKPLHDQIMGNWYLCNTDGSYNEMHIYDTYILSYTESGVINSGAKVYYILSYYRIINDSIQTSSEPIDSTNWKFQRPKKITIKNNDELVWVNNWKRLKNEVYSVPQNANTEELEFFIKEYKKRLIMYGCNDLRSAEEKVQDSIIEDQLNSINKELDEIFDSLGIENSDEK